MKLKTIMMSVTMLMGMGMMMMVPQAEAGGSALESWRLPWGLEFSKEIPGKVQRKGGFNDNHSTLTFSGSVSFHVKERLLYMVLFDEKMPKAFRALGIEWAEGRHHKGTPLSTVREVILQQGGKISDDSISDKESRSTIVVTFGSSPYEFNFGFNKIDGQRRLVALWITESLGEF